MWRGLDEVSVEDGVERETVATRYPASTKPLASAVPILEPAPKMTATSDVDDAIMGFDCEVSGGKNLLLKLSRCCCLFGQERWL